MLLLSTCSIVCHWHVLHKVCGLKWIHISVDRNRPYTSESLLFFQGVFNRETQWDQTGSFSLFIIQVNFLYSNILRIGKTELNLSVRACTHPLSCFPGMWTLKRDFFRMIRWANILDVRKSPIGLNLCLFRRPYWSSAAPTTARSLHLPRSNTESAPKPLISQSLPVAAQTWWADLKADCFEARVHLSLQRLVVRQILETCFALCI